MEQKGRVSLPFSFYPPQSTTDEQERYKSYIQEEIPENANTKAGPNHV
jgi:hypothetical protein